MAKAIGCAKSALLQNPKLRELLAELEDGLRASGVLPPLKQSDTPEGIEKHDQGAIKNDIKNARLQRLEQRVVELEAENKSLRTKISRFSELSTVLSELGRLPE